jgi:hypothetical protein
MTVIEHKEKDHTKASQPIQEEPAFTFFHAPVASSLSNSHSITSQVIIHRLYLLLAAVAIITHSFNHHPPDR